MEPPQAHHLRQEFNAAFARSSDPQVLQSLHAMLRQSKQTLRDPLRTPGKNAEQRKALEEAKTKPADPVHLPGRAPERILEPQRRLLIDAAIALSDRLLLSEARCWDLVKAANNQQRRAIEQAEILFLAAETIFFKERALLLACLLELLKGRGDSSASQGLRDLLIAFSNELLKDGLAKELCKYLTNQPGGLPHAIATIPATAESPNALRTYYWTEMKVIAECIFYIYYQTTITPDEAERVLQLLKEFSRSIKYQGGEEKPVPLPSRTGMSTQLPVVVVKSVIYQPLPESVGDYTVAYILLLSVMSFLELTSPFVDPRKNVVSENKLLNPESRDFIAKLARDCQEGNVNDIGPFYGAVAFALGRFFLQRANMQPNDAEDRKTEGLFRAALNQNAFVVLRDIVLSRPFANDDANKPVFLGVLDELITTYLTLNAMHIRHMKNAEEEAHRALQQGQGYGPPPPTPAQHYINLLKVIVAVYRDRPEMQEKFWLPDENEGPYRFLKFVAGENLAEWFFVPFVDMVASLASSAQSAPHAYVMLKDYGKYANWDHFFRVLEQYYLDFQETSTDVVAAEGPGRKDLREADMMGLQAILRLVQEIARHSPSNASMMAENLSWHVLESLFGLLSCPVSAALKGELLNTITCFAAPGNKDVLVKVWSLLESTQVLMTVPATQPGAPPRDIAFELQEVERAAGTYPETVAFLKLLAELLVTATPSMLARLGSTYRQGGFTPYLTFVRDVVFVQHDIQPYVHKGEKWKIAAAALLVMYRVVKDYDPRDDVAQPPAPTQPVGGYLYPQPAPILPPTAPANPAAELYRYLLSSSERNKLLGILSTGADLLTEKRFSSAEGADMENAVLLALKIVDSIMTKEAAGNLMGSQHSMDRLLVSKKLVVPISRYATYAYNNEVTRLAVRTLDALAMKKQPLVSIFQEAREDEAIIESLSERLDSDEPLERDDAEENGGSSVRSAILLLMLRPLRDASPDAAKFSHMLLGFDVADHPRSLSNTRSLPGGVNATSHCFGVMLSLLDSPSFAVVHPHQARLALEILYRLVSSRFTAERTLQFVRNRPAQQKDFFSDLIQQQITSFRPDDSATLLSALWQRTYLLKSLAIDLRMCEREGQRTRENHLLAMLLLVQSPLEDQSEADEFEPQGGFSSMQGDLAQPRLKMLELLDFISFINEEPRAPPPPRFIQLDPAGYTRPLPAHRDLQLIDLMALHRDMLLLLQRAEAENVYSMQQLQQMQAEIRDMLNHALQRNKWRALHHAKLQLFDSWNQLLAVCLTVCYAQLRTLEKREEIVYTLIDSLADKLKLRENTSDREAASITNGISAALLMLITRLRELGDVSGMRPVARLHTILEALLQALMAPGTSAFLRMNLYASLSNYLHFCQQSILNVVGPTSQVAGFEDAQSAFRAFLQTDEVSALQKQLEQGNQQRLGAIGTENLNVGERLVELMSHDACNSTPACRAVSFAALDTLLFYDLYHKWLTQMATKGYLRFFVDQITTPLPAELQARATAMMVSESVLSLFKRIASSERGARQLISMGLIARLAEADFLNSPSLSSAIVAPPPGEDQLMTDEASTEKLPQQALVLQVIQILTSILLTLRPNNEDAAQQVLDFIKRHSHLFSAILKDRRTKDLTALRSLQMVTSLLYQLAPYETLFQQRLELKAAKFEYLMMNLVVAFFTSDEVSMSQGRFSALAFAEEADFDPHSEASLVRQQSTLICRNLVGYLRIKARRPGRFGSPVLFSPQLIGGQALESMSVSSASSSRFGTPNASFASATSGRSGPVGRGKLPSLGVLVDYLQSCLERLSRNVDHYTSIQRALTHINDMPVQQLTKLAEKPLASAVLSVPLARDGSNRVLLAQLHLQDELATRLRESSTLLYNIENLLHLIWTHLSFFLSPDAASSVAPAVPDSNAAFANRQRGPSVVLTVAKQEELRRDAHSLLNPILTQLAKLERPHGSEFVALLIRQLRALSTSQN